MKHRAAITLILLLSGAASAAPSASGAVDYRQIDTSMAGQVVTLSGSDLTLEQLIAVARHGAHVQLSAQAREFGTAAWHALRIVVPLELEDQEHAPQSPAVAAAAFIRATPASTFYTGGAAMPASSEQR
jgi:hypothetical protein